MPAQLNSICLVRAKTGPHNTCNNINMRTGYPARKAGQPSETAPSLCAPIGRRLAALRRRHPWRCERQSTMHTTELHLATNKKKRCFHHAVFHYWCEVSRALLFCFYTNLAPLKKKKKKVFHKKKRLKFEHPPLSHSSETSSAPESYASAYFSGLLGKEETQVWRIKAKD